jgi:hypothetical protein
MLRRVTTEVDPEPALTNGVDLHHRIRTVAATVAVVSRLATLTMVALSVAALVHADGYSNGPLAATVYVAVAGWGAVFIVLLLRRDPVPGWVLTVDVGVTGACVACPTTCPARWSRRCTRPARRR